ncbi:MAG TPA: methyltransferase domain-containing protein [Candidatus Kapabacteria bacterium]|nr:methyltransferase domain-containing protein [Candidatus Kapabacteria bacterium]
MRKESESTWWVPACDLCGNLEHAEERTAQGLLLRRCRKCGLISIAHDEPRPAAGTMSSVPPALQREALRSLLGRSSPSVLVLGEPAPSLVGEAAEMGIALSALVEPGHAPIDGVRTFAWSLEGAAFAAESFDCIIDAVGLERYPAPSLLFDRARRWLNPGGRLIVAALNASSLPARLNRRSWLHRFAEEARHLFTPPVLGEYASRFGFNVASVQSRSAIRDVAASIFGTREPGIVATVTAAPVALASSLFGMGLVILMELTNDGYAVRPVVRKAENAMEGAQGLAPALYTGVHRKKVAEYA